MAEALRAPPLYLPDTFVPKPQFAKPGGALQAMFAMTLRVRLGCCMSACLIACLPKTASLIDGDSHSPTAFRLAELPLLFVAAIYSETSR